MAYPEAPKNAEALSLHSTGHDSAIQIYDHQEPHATTSPHLVVHESHAPATVPQDEDEANDDDDDDPEDDGSDSGFESESLLGDETDTLASSIMHYRIENGRQYHAYRDGAYWGPNDEVAKEILDFAHHMYFLTLDRKLHMAPLKDPQRILDVGTGTGIWAIDMAGTLVWSPPYTNMHPYENRPVPSRNSHRHGPFSNTTRMGSPKLHVRNRRRNPRMDIPT